MSITANFKTLLAEVDIEQIVASYFKDHTRLLGKVPKYTKWTGGDLPVPIETSGEGSHQIGGLVPVASINPGAGIKPKLDSDDFITFNGALKFQSRDLRDIKIARKHFMGDLKRQIRANFGGLERKLTTAFLAGPGFATATVNGTNGGVLVVDNSHRFHLNQEYVIRESDGPNAVAGFVRKIDPATKAITFYDAISGGSVVDLSAYTVAKGTKVYHKGEVNTSTGAMNATYFSLKGMGLSNTNGGDATFLDKTKTDYPHVLHGYEKDASGFTPETFLDDLFWMYQEYQRSVPGDPAMECWLSGPLFARAMMAVNDQKGGQYYVVPDSNKPQSVISWHKITIGSPLGYHLTLVHKPELGNTEFFFCEMNYLKVYCDGLVHFEQDEEDGKIWHRVRVDDDSYYFVIDTAFSGNIVLKKPMCIGVGYGVPSTVYSRS